MSTSSWKIAPVLLALALGFVVLVAGNGVRPVSADVATITVNDNTITSGQVATVSIDAEANDGTLTVSLSGVALTTTPLLTIECGTCDEEGNSNSSSVSMNTADAQFPADGNVQVTLELTCTADDTVTVNASQPGDTSNTVSVTCNPGQATITVVMDAPGAASSVDFELGINAPGTHACEDSSFILSENESAGFACNAGEYTITQITTPAGYSLSAITCTDTNIPNADITVELTNKRVTVILSDANDTAECTFTQVVSASPTPTPTTTPSGATAVTVSAAPSTVSCNGSSFVTVVVKSGTTNVVDGTNVSVASTSGSLSPASAPTSGGGILTIFTAGSTSGTSTITASSGGVSGTTSITVNCGAPTAVPTSPPAPPPPVATVAPAGGIRPPNTGDAGLASDGGFNWLATGAVLMIAGSAVSGLVLARRRA